MINTQQAVGENTYPASQDSHNIQQAGYDKNTQQAVGENTYPASQDSHNIQQADYDKNTQQAGYDTAKNPADS